MPVFWSRWIKAVSFFLMVYGLAMIFVPETMNRTLVGALLYNNNVVLRDALASVAEPDLTFIKVLGGLLGTVTVGWSIQMAWIAHYPFRNGETWAWNALLLSLSAWAILEFYFKLTDDITGLGLFAHFGLLVIMGIPLLATYRYFHPARAVLNQ